MGFARAQPIRNGGVMIPLAILIAGKIGWSGRI
jgi:hypothetical protein